MTELAPWQFVLETGRLVTQRRIAAGLSQHELAAKSGLTRSLIANIEVGRRTPTFQSIATIAKALGCSVESLMPHPATPTPERV